MARLVDRLSGGDLRSIGRADEVVAEVLSDKKRIGEIIDGLDHPDRVVRMRCADVAEKISGHEPAWLIPYRTRLLGLALRASDIELRWHLAQMLPRLGLDARGRRRATDLLFTYLEDNSRIVRTSALQALCELSLADPALRRRVEPLVERLTREAGAVGARARKLTRVLAKGSGDTRRSR